MDQEQHDWSVTVEVVPEDPDATLYDADDEEGLIADLIALAEEVLPESSPVVSYLPTTLAISVVIDSPGTGAKEAAMSALGSITKVLEKVLPRSWDVVALRSVRGDVLERELAEPSVPPLLGVSELAETIGVSKARASELARTGTFPAPVADLAAGPVWAEPTVTRFVETWQRRPGRPARATAVG